MHKPLVHMCIHVHEKNMHVHTVDACVFYSGVDTPYPFPKQHRQHRNGI